MDRNFDKDVVDVMCNWVHMLGQRTQTSPLTECSTSEDAPPATPDKWSARIVGVIKQWELYKIITPE
jgi:hypothetical protein